MDHYRDERIVCVSCGNSFVFTAAEAAHFAERGLSAPPKRCRECRRARKEQFGDAQRTPNGMGGRHEGRHERHGQGYGQARGAGRGEPRQEFRQDEESGGYNRPHRGGGPRMPSHTGNVNEYRSPMQVGPSSQPDYRSPMGGEFRSQQSEYRGPMQGGRRPTAAEYRSPMQGGARPGRSEYRGPMQGGGSAGAGRRGPGNARGRGRFAAVDDGNYRAPSFRDDYASPPQHGSSRPRGPQGPQGPQGHQGHQGYGGPPREPRSRELYSITCNACGAESQVPFRPDEGREVFCQACYRARKPA